MGNFSYSTIIGTGCDDIVIEWIPLDVQNGASMSSYSTGIEVKTTGLQNKTKLILLY